MAASSKIEQLLRDLQVSKSASVGSNDPLKDPGGHSGPSTHLSAKGGLDDGLMRVQTGARSAENTADIKRTIPGPNVDSLPEAKATSSTAGQNRMQLNIGVNQSATGEDPAVEDDYKDHYTDPGTTALARTDRGEKYSATMYQELLAKPFDKLATEATALGNELLADMVERQQKAAGNPTGSQAQGNPALQAPIQESATKQAQVVYLTEGLVKEAFISADLVAAHLNNVYRKHAGEGDPEEKPPEAGGPPEGGPGGPPMPPMSGGPPPGGMPGGMDPLAAAGAGMPGMDAPPDQGGPAISPDEAVHELAAALSDMGISPEHLMAVAQKMSEQGSAGAPGPGGPGGPPGGMPDGAKMGMAQDLFKAAKRVQLYKRAGHFDSSKPATKRAQMVRANFRNMIAEILKVHE